MTFDAAKFESLQGIEAANYALEVMRSGVSEQEIIPYYTQSVATLDWPRLQLVLGIIAKVGTEQALHLVSNYLGDSNFNIRLVAVKTVAQVSAVDSYVMERVVASLVKEYDYAMHLGLNEEIKAVLKRPANEEARRIAEEFLYGGRKG